MWIHKGRGAKTQHNGEINKRDREEAASVAGRKNSKEKVGQYSHH